MEFLQFTVECAAGNPKLSDSISCDFTSQPGKSFSDIFGDILPSMNIKVAGIALIILGIASIPVSRVAAKKVEM